MLLHKLEFSKPSGLQAEGAPLPERTIFVSRVIRSNEDDIKKCLTDTDDNVNNIIKSSHNDAKYKSFKIKISIIDLDKVLNNYFWPNGILCQMWREPRIKIDTSNNIDYEYDY